MMNSRQNGFTLIELMIVISIIGVLAAIAVPNFRTARERSIQRSCYANQKTIMGAIESYHLDKGRAILISEGSTAELELLVESKLLVSVSLCPGCANRQIYSSDSWGNVFCKFHGTITGDELTDAAGNRTTSSRSTGSNSCE
jgi:prepilin-type N-terminal cleavage/methylation domain-containing protein